MASPGPSSPSLALTPARPPKKSRGRQKVKMVRMEKDSNRQVTFSKRRCGLFKKANELCTLCGAEVAIVVFSPGNKAFSFGHPSVETILNRFLKPNSSADPDSKTLIELAQRRAAVRELNIALNTINDQLDAVKTKGEEIILIKRAKEQLYWWDRSVDDMSFQHLIHLRTALEGLKKNVFQYGKAVAMFNNAASANAGAAATVVHHFPILEIKYPPLVEYDGAIYNRNGDFVGYRQDYF